jgi:hypothetical protein
MNDAMARGPPWTDEAVARLRQRLLDDALRRLSRRRTRNKDRQRLMAWVLLDAIHPFSFRVCAGVSGYDADALRDGVLRLLRSMPATAYLADRATLCNAMFNNFRQN